MGYSYADVPTNLGRAFQHHPWFFGITVVGDKEEEIEGAMHTLDEIVATETGTALLTAVRDAGAKPLIVTVLEWELNGYCSAATFRRMKPGESQEDAIRATFAKGERIEVLDDQLNRKSLRGEGTGRDSSLHLRRSAITRRCTPKRGLELLRLCGAPHSRCNSSRTRTLVRILKDSATTNRPKAWATSSNSCLPSTGSGHGSTLNRLVAGSRKAARLSACCRFAATHCDSSCSSSSMRDVS